MKKAEGGSPAATLSTVGPFGHAGQQMVTQNRQKTSKQHETQTDRQTDRETKTNRQNPY